MEDFFLNMKSKIDICGDFIVNSLNYGQHVETTIFFYSLISLTLFPCIAKPTSITIHSTSLIDNIFANNICNERSCGILINDISDNFPIFMLAKYCIHKDCNRQYMYTREKDKLSQ